MSQLILLPGDKLKRDNLPYLLFTFLQICDYTVIITIIIIIIITNVQKQHLRALKVKWSKIVYFYVKSN